MGADRTASPALAARRSAKEGQPAGGHQRDLLSAPDRLPVAAPAQGLSTLGNRLVVLSAMAPGRGLDRDPPRSLSSGTRQDGSAARAERRDHGRPVGKDDGKRGIRGFDGHKRVKGRKRHLLVDTLGLPIAGRVEPAGMSDRRAGARLVAGAQARFQMYVQGTSELPLPFLVVVVIWLMILFAGYGLIAARNPTVLVFLLAANVSVSGAVFLIQELATPFGGVIRVSSAPMREVIAHLGG
jgi:Transposase DDE domain